MSFKDFVDAVSVSKEINQEGPVFGDAMLAKGKKKKEFKVVVKYKICYLSDPEHQDIAESIFTRSLECENMLHKVGDICVFKEESNFSKEGDYCVVIKFAECVKDTDDDDEVTNNVL